MIISQLPWATASFAWGSAHTVSYIGDRLGDADLKNRSDTDAQKIYDLFTFGDFNTFSEYNSATYTGVGQ
jgi:hypothetical protein